MNYHPQSFAAPDGTEMVILPAADYARLKRLAENGEDVADANAILARIAGGEGTMPGEVLALILDEGLHPIAAWRRHRGLSQAELARRAGLSQVWVSRIEAGGGHGTPKTRRKLAEALGAPVWGLETEEGEVEVSPSTGKGKKYLPLRDYLRVSGKASITLGFDAIGDLVGGLPPSAATDPEWWENGDSHSQAVGWLGAGYEVRADRKRKVATFTRRS